MKITNLSVLDLRFPTSKDQVGTDAVHTDPDYSAAYVILETDAGLEGHGLTFTVGRGNEVCAAAIEAFRHLVVGRAFIERNIPIGYFGEPEDVAHLVAFLASPQARYITGTVIPVDAGNVNRR